MSKQNKLTTSDLLCGEGDVVEEPLAVGGVLPMRLGAGLSPWNKIGVAEINYGTTA